MLDIKKTVGDIIDEQKVCYITSIDSDGFPNTKAMLQPRKRNGISEIFFSTNTSSLKVESFRANAKSCVYFCDSSFFRGVMLKGMVEVIEDQAVKDMLWKIGDTMYYSKGKTDPDYCVLKLTVISGRYYSDFKSEDFEV